MFTPTPRPLRRPTGYNVREGSLILAARFGS